MQTQFDVDSKTRNHHHRAKADSDSQTEFSKASGAIIYSIFIRRIEKDGKLFIPRKRRHGCVGKFNNT